MDLPTATMPKVCLFFFSLYRSALFWVPTVDGEFLPDEPNVLMESERVHHVDVLSGVVKDEGATQTGIPTPWSPNCIRPQLSP